MTLAVAGPNSLQPTAPPAVPIAILGTDALLAALPATPVQLAHACLKAGFANVIPASWGDELIATAVLRRLPQFGGGPAIQCSCPIVAHRLLTVGGDLRPVLVTLVPPPVAIARYVRALSQPTRARVTYVGSCPGATDDSIDIRMTPESLIAMLAERRIVPEDQPRVFESVIPPDRRRFRSQPGGIPTVEALWSEAGARTLAEIDGDDVAAEMAQLLLSGKNVLIDVSTRLGCICSGAVPGVAPGDARGQVVMHEPPRAVSPVVEERLSIELDSPVPAMSRTPIDVMAISTASAGPQPITLAQGGDMPLGHRSSPVRGTTALTEPRSARTSGGSSRPVQKAVPVSRDVEGKSLPRAYVARRRSSPKGIPVISLPADTPSNSSTAIDAAASALSTRLPSAVEPTAPSPWSAGWPVPRRQLLYLVVAIVALAALVSTAVVLVVGRSMNSPTAAASTPR